MENCNKHFKAVVNKQQHRRHSDCSCMQEFIKQQQEVLEDLAKGVWALVEETGVEVATIKLALNEVLCYFTNKQHKAQLIMVQIKENHLTRAKKLVNKLKHPVEPNMI